MRLYTLNDIQNAVSASAFSRGVGYHRQGRVRQVRFGRNGETIDGKVQGTEPRPYETYVEIIPLPAGARVVGSCSCPVGFNCKHVAALLIAGLTIPEGRRLARREEAAGVEPPLAAWLRAVEQAVAPAPRNDYPPDVRQRLIYVLDRGGERQVQGSPSVALLSARVLKDGSFGRQTSHYNPENAWSEAPAKFLRPNDVDILRWISRHIGHGASGGVFQLTGADGAWLLEAMVQTGRCRWRDLDGPVLSRGQPRKGEPHWAIMADGVQHFGYGVEGADAVFALVPPWFVDGRAKECGPVKTGLPDRVAGALLAAPPVPPEHAAAVRRELEARLPACRRALPRDFGEAARREVTPIPHLRLFVQEMSGPEYYGGWSYAREAVPLARLSFDYGAATVAGRDSRSEVVGLEEERLVAMPRDRRAEAAAFGRLLDEFGFRPVIDLGLHAVPEENRADLRLLPDDPARDRDEALLDFCYRHVPRLRAEGWRVEIDPAFPLRIAEPEDDWHATVEDDASGMDWFGFRLGVTVEGERIDLLPLLLTLLDQLQGGARWGLQDLSDDSVLFAPLADGRRLPLPLGRLRPLLSALLEMHQLGSIGADGRVRLTRDHAAELADFESATAGANLRWFGGERLRDLGRALRDVRGIAPTALPPGFRGALRPYQQSGLDWLQFLRANAFGGILADDMGLGKTIQTLAHLLAEKESGRMDRPSLVVAPTSLMANWRLEARRFAPDLKVLTLHGPDRRQRFERIADSELVLTTYALLPRDKEALLAHDYHLLILDEAQNVKNPSANASIVAGKLEARHRLCLTGTPMENNLGELWSLFHFLMPGLLGDHKQFRQVFRTPVEKHGDETRRRLLSRRVRPFLLRRCKQEVAAELPEKTEIAEHVDLDGPQRDLYESIRLAMHDKVRAEIARKGMNRSHIVILDALLKLRQVCCDPRLLPLKAAARVRQSAKLVRLFDMVPEMVAEGRRILLFSQFTSMLALIETELVKRGLDYVTLTGRTKDRLTPVERFQGGKVPLFLISLKAGGTGLNLTAADTVIHYDPWWNPAVEAQATDRAHRIGQDKAIFVYKLMTLGTVEEKMVELQERKRALAAGLFDGDAGALANLSEDELNALFEPLGAA